MRAKTKGCWEIEFFKALFHVQKISQVLVQKCVWKDFDFISKKLQPPCIDKTKKISYSRAQSEL